MDAKSLAELLNGREYGEEITPQEEAFAKENNLAVVLGYSDDGVIFTGAIREHISAYNGTTIVVINDKAVDRYEMEEDREILEKYGIVLKDFRIVEAIWDPKEIESSWLIETEGGHPFDIMEDGRLFCRGVVFSIK